MKLGVSSRAVEKRIKTLRENGVIRRIGGDKGGYWEVIENGIEQQQHAESGVKGGVKDGVKELSDIQEIIVKEMLFDPSITTSEMAQKTGIKFRTLQRHISQLQAMGIVVRKDGRKDGYWEVVKNKQSSNTIPQFFSKRKKTGQNRQGNLCPTPEASVYLQPFQEGQRHLQSIEGSTALH